MPWKEVETYLTADLMVTARFEVQANRVKELQVILHKAAGGTDAWIVRIETHGGLPHKHVAWDDDGENRHKPLKGWPKDYPSILSKAISDLKENGEKYEARYDAWTQKAAKK